MLENRQPPKTLLLYALMHLSRSAPFPLRRLGCRIYNKSFWCGPSISVQRELGRSGPHFAILRGGMHPQLTLHMLNYTFSIYLTWRWGFHIQIPYNNTSTQVQHDWSVGSVFFSLPGKSCSSCQGHDCLVSHAPAARGMTYHAMKTHWPSKALIV